MELTHYNLDAYNALLRLRRERRISWRAFGLGMVIASFANKDTGESWPLRATLSAITGIDMRDISRTIRELENAKFLTVSGRDGQSNIYRLTLGRFATLGDSATLGDLPPTLGETTSKPLGVLPPITIEEQSKNNEYAQNNILLSHGEQGEKRRDATDEPGSPPSPADAPPIPLKPTRAKKPAAPKAAWDGKDFLVPDALMAIWRDAYGKVDVPEQIKKASAWCVSNPRKAPKSDFTRFLNGWLGRATPDRGKKSRFYEDDDSYELTGDSLAAAIECANLFGRAANE